MDVERSVLIVRPITDGGAVACPRPRGRSATERAPATTILVAAADAGTSLVEYRTLSRGFGGGGYGGIDDEGVGVVGNSFAVELDRDPSAGVDAGHEVLGRITGGSNINGRSGESSLAEDGQEGKPGKIDDEHSVRGLLDAAVLANLRGVDDGVRYAGTL